MQRFKLYSTGTSVTLSWGAPALMLIFGLVILLMLFTGKSAVDYREVIFLLIWIVMVSWMLRGQLSMPKEIILEDEGLIRFKSSFSDIEIRVSEIESIMPGKNNIGYLDLTHSSGKISFLNQFDDFHILLSRLKSMNSNIETRGC